MYDEYPRHVALCLQNETTVTSLAEEAIPFYRREQKDAAAKADKMSVIVRSGERVYSYTYTRI